MAEPISIDESGFMTRAILLDALVEYGKGTFKAPPDLSHDFTPEVCEYLATPDGRGDVAEWSGMFESALAALALFRARLLLHHDAVKIAEMEKAVDAQQRSLRALEAWLGTGLTPWPLVAS